MVSGRASAELPFANELVGSPGPCRGRTSSWLTLCCPEFPEYRRSVTRSLAPTERESDRPSSSAVTARCPVRKTPYGMGPTPQRELVGRRLSSAAAEAASAPLVLSVYNLSIIHARYRYDDRGVIARFIASLTLSTKFLRLQPRINAPLLSKSWDATAGIYHSSAVGGAGIASSLPEDPARDGREDNGRAPESSGVLQDDANPSSSFAEGATDRAGNSPLSRHCRCSQRTYRRGMRESPSGHVQRGGAPSAYGPLAIHPSAFAAAVQETLNC